MKTGRSDAVEACDDPIAWNSQVIGSTEPTVAGAFRVADPVIGSLRRSYRVKVLLVPLIPLE